MNENDLKAQLKKQFAVELPRYVVQSHWELLSGRVDISVTGDGHTTWLELKLYVGKALRSNVQTINAMKLAVAGRCRYVIYYSYQGKKWTFIVEPKYVHDGTWETNYEEGRSGFDHQFVIEYIRRTHGA